MKNMKKLLGALVALGLGTTTVMTTVACNGNKPKPKSLVDDLKNSFDATYSAKSEQMAGLGLTQNGTGPDQKTAFDPTHVTLAGVQAVVKVKDGAPITDIYANTASATEPTAVGQEMVVFTATDVANTDVMVAADNTVVVNLTLTLYKSVTAEDAFTWAQQPITMNVVITVSLPRSLVDDLKDSFHQAYTAKYDQMAGFGLSGNATKASFDPANIKLATVQAVVTAKDGALVKDIYAESSTAPTAASQEMAVFAAKDAKNDNVTVTDNTVVVNLTLSLYQSVKDADKDTFSWVDQSVKMDVAITVPVVDDLQNSFSATYSATAEQMAGLGVSGNATKAAFDPAHMTLEGVQAIVKAKKDDALVKDIYADDKTAPTVAGQQMAVFAAKDAKNDSVTITDSKTVVNLTLTLYVSAKDADKDTFSWIKQTVTMDIAITVSLPSAS